MGWAEAMAKLFGMDFNSVTQRAIDSAKQAKQTNQPVLNTYTDRTYRDVMNSKGMSVVTHFMPLDTRPALREGKPEKSSTPSRSNSTGSSRRRRRRKATRHRHRNYSGRRF